MDFLLLTVKYSFTSSCCVFPNFEWKSGHRVSTDLRWPASLLRSSNSQRKTFHFVKSFHKVSYALCILTCLQLVRASKSSMKCLFCSRFQMFFFFSHLFLLFIGTNQQFIWKEENRCKIEKMSENSQTSILMNFWMCKAPESWSIYTKTL